MQRTTRLFLHGAAAGFTLMVTLRTVSAVKAPGLRNFFRNKHRRTAVTPNEVAAFMSQKQEPRDDARPSEQEIAEKAHQLWVARGCPAGSAETDWYRAERELRSGGMNYEQPRGL